jgi:hypothetical protein
LELNDNRWRYRSEEVTIPDGIYTYTCVLNEHKPLRQAVREIKHRFRNLPVRDHFNCAEPFPDVSALKWFPTIRCLLIFVPSCPSCVLSFCRHLMWKTSRQKACPCLAIPRTLFHEYGLFDHLLQTTAETFLGHQGDCDGVCWKQDVLGDKWT